MKKAAALIISVTSLLAPVKAFAADNEIILNIIGPHGGYKDIGSAISNVLTLIFSFALLAVLIMLVWGAFEWIVSGGDKEAVGKARNRILNALIGLAVLSIAFALAKVAGQFAGFGNDFSLRVPTPPNP